MLQPTAAVVFTASSGFSLLRPSFAERSRPVPSEQNPACVPTKTLYLPSLPLFRQPVQASHTLTSFHRASHPSSPSLRPLVDLNAVKNDSSSSPIAFDNNSAEAPLAAGESAAPVGSCG